MTAPFAILAPHLDTRDTKFLKSALSSARLPLVTPTDTLPTDDTRFVLSAGKDALDVWHDFGLIRVGANHGHVFSHVHPVSGRTYHIMVVEHPGAMAQTSLGIARDARERMKRDLMEWTHLLSNLSRGARMPRSTVCGGCLKHKDVLHRRRVEHLVAELDMAGLCDDHYRKRAAYKRKVPRVAKKDAGKSEHQIAGQVEAFPGDGTRLVVSKK